MNSEKRKKTLKIDLSAWMLRTLRERAELIGKTDKQVVARLIKLYVDGRIDVLSEPKEETKAQTQAVLGGEDNGRFRTEETKKGPQAQEESWWQRISREQSWLRQQERSEVDGQHKSEDERQERQSPREPSQRQQRDESRQYESWV